MKQAIDIETLKRSLRRAYNRLGSWQAVGERYGVNRGIAWRIVNEEKYEPKGAHIRARLGLPALVPAPVCRKCGEVHTTQRCTKNGRRVVNWRWLFGMDEETFEERWREAIVGTGNGVPRPTKGAKQRRVVRCEKIVS